MSGTDGPPSSGRADPAPAHLLKYWYTTKKGDFIGGNWRVPQGDFRAFLGIRRPSRKERKGREKKVSASRTIEVAFYEAFEEIGEGAAKHGQQARNQWISHVPFTQWPGREQDMFTDMRDSVLQSQEKRTDTIEPGRYLRAGAGQYWRLIEEMHERSKEDNKKYLFIQYKWAWQNKSYDTISNMMKVRYETRRAEPRSCTLLLTVAVVGLCTSAHAQRENAVVPRPGTDFTAYRFDAAVIGWNRDFSELAAVAIEIFRDARSTQRGDVTLLVFDIGATVPRDKSFLLNHTQAALPDDPLPLLSISDRDWCAGKAIKDTWRQRPLARRPAGGMRIETVWAPIELPEGVCQPHVGLMLEHQGRVRYQAMPPLRVWAPCRELRLTDEATQWAKTDLAAVLLRFDFTPSSGDRLLNERSARFALSAVWGLARPLQIVVRSQGTTRRRAERVKRLVRGLAPFGRVQVEHAADGRPRGVILATTPQLAHLRPWLVRQAQRVLRAEHVAEPDAADRAGSIPAGADVLIAMGDLPARTSTAPSPASRQHRRPAPPAPQQTAPQTTSVYLNDWALQ
jgi:hypothetical protein